MLLPDGVVGVELEGVIDLSVCDKDDSVGEVGFETIEIGGLEDEDEDEES